MTPESVPREVARAKEQHQEEVNTLQKYIEAQDLAFKSDRDRLRATWTPPGTTAPCGCRRTPRRPGSSTR